MATPTAGKSLEQAEPMVKQNGLNTQKASNLAGFLVDTSGNVTRGGGTDGAVDVAQADFFATGHGRECSEPTRQK